MVLQSCSKTAPLSGQVWNIDGQWILALTEIHEYEPVTSKLFIYASWYGKAECTSF